MGSIRYLNTDLDIVSAEEPTRLVAALCASGVRPLGDPYKHDEEWRTTFEADERGDEPESTLRAILNAAEALAPLERQAWDACESRAFDIGYRCGDTPRHLIQAISNETLSRITAAGAILRIILYRSDPPSKASAIAKHRRARRR